MKASALMDVFYMCEILLHSNTQCRDVHKSSNASLSQVSELESEASLKSPEWCSQNNSMTIEIHHNCYANRRYRFGKLGWH